MGLYHSALKKGSITYRNVNETLRANHPKGVMIKNDVMSQGLPIEFSNCDILYAEPPWSHGFHVFNKRVGVSGITYADFCEAIKKIILRWDKPIYLLLSQAMLKILPKPRELHDTILNEGDALLGVWNDSYSGSLVSTEYVCQELGRKYKTMGDFTCGYGDCVINFLSGGGRGFVASDYDGKCITVMAARMKKIK